MNMSIDSFQSGLDIMKKGRLDNGLSYYFCNNDAAEDSVCISLTVKTGSLMEDGFNNGIAHFIEHMCIYNSDCTYAGKESYKNVFMSGYTDFEETVYFLNCKTERIKDVLNAFRNIISGQNLVRSSMDTIKSELRFEINDQMETSKYRLQQLIIPELVQAENIKNKLPLGTLECIENLRFEDVQKFHKKWYKPENCAVIIAGAVENYKAEALLQQLFSKTEEVILDNKRPSVKSGMVSDKVIINTVSNLKHDYLQLYYSGISLNYDAADHLKTKILNYFSLIVIESYIREKLQKKNIDFIDLNFVSERLLGKLNFNVMEFTVKENLFEKSEEIFSIIKNIISDGIAESHFINTKELFLKQLSENYLAGQNAGNRDIVDECIQNYLYNEPIISLNYEYTLCSSTITEVSFKDISIIIKNILGSNSLTSFNLKDESCENQQK